MNETANDEAERDLPVEWSTMSDADKRLFLRTRREMKQSPIAANTADTQVDADEPLRIEAEAYVTAREGNYPFVEDYRDGIVEGYIAGHSARDEEVKYLEEIEANFGRIAKENSDLRGEVRRLTAKVKAMDVNRSLRGYDGLADENKRLKDELNTLEITHTMILLREKSLREALEKYGRHDVLCGIVGGYGQCTCGLAALKVTEVPK